MTIEDVIKLFYSEFNNISSKFEFIEEFTYNLKDSTRPFIAHPGVYVFLKNDTVIKVGRHLKNSRKRALEHLRDNTRSDTFEMKNLYSCRTSKILLINLKNPTDYHWAAAVEIFLENNLKPLIRSKRL